MGSHALLPLLLDEFTQKSKPFFCVIIVPKAKPRLLSIRDAYKMAYYYKQQNGRIYRFSLLAAFF